MTNPHVLWAVGAGKPLGVQPLSNEAGGSAVVVAESADALDQAGAHGIVNESTRLFLRDDVVAAASAVAAARGTIFQGRFDAVGTEIRSVGRGTRCSCVSGAARWRTPNASGAD